MPDSRKDFHDGNFRAKNDRSFIVYRFQPACVCTAVFRAERIVTDTSPDDRGIGQHLSASRLLAYGIGNYGQLCGWLCDLVLHEQANVE
jgi:hypothetical protein